MIPVTQTITVDQIANVPGNCFAAAVASVMDLPIEAVPHFMLFDKRWVDVFTLWLEIKGYDFHYTEDEKETPKDTYYLLTGKSPRGDFNHTVVARNGKIEHDPHPSRQGIESFAYAMWGSVSTETE